MKYSTERIIGDLTKALTERSFVMDPQWALNLLHETATRLRNYDALLRAAKGVKMAVIVYALPTDSEAFERAIAACEKEG
jgi:hypothetical protein